MSRSISKDAVPYKLHALMRAKGLRQADLCAHIVFEAGSRKGQPVGVSVINTLLARRTWPKTISAKVIVDAAHDFMQRNGFSADEIAEAWKPEREVYDAGPPLGRPTLQMHTAPTNQPSHTEDDPFDYPEPEMLSAHAREKFHITRHPFLEDVQGPQDVFLAKDQRYIRETMYQAAKHAGLIAIIGESGSGKTTLRRDLLDRLRRDSEPLVVIQPKTIDKKKLTADHICDAVIFELSTERPKTRLESKARQVERILTNSAHAGNAHVIMIEEAHDLTTPTIKYLKRFWELEDGFRKLLGVILIGQPELGDLLDERRNYEAREFIRRCEVAWLKPLNGNLEEYIGLKFKRVGLDLNALFERDAFDAIRQRLTRKRPGRDDVESHLFPLVVNNLVIKCLNQAAEIGLPKVNADLVARI